MLGHDGQVHEEPCRRLGHPHPSVRQIDQPPVDQPVPLGIPRPPLHNVRLGPLVGQGDGGQHVGPKVDEEDGDGGEGQGDVEHHPGQEGQDLRDVGGQGVHDGLFEVVENDPPLLHAGDDRGKVVVEKDHVGGLLGDLGARDAHRHADVCLLQGRGVVNPVA